MIIDTSRISGPCVCGQTHRVKTRQAVIEPGCMKRFDELLAAAGLQGHRTAIYDTNTHQARGLHRPRVDQEIILPAESLAATEAVAEALLRRLSGETRVLIAIGSGLLQDLVRLCASRLHVPYVACPTAASNDSFASGVSWIWHGGMRSIEAAPGPELVIADVDVIRQAPEALTRAGVGEAMSKFTAMADWRATGLLTGRKPCAVVESLLQQAAVAAQGCVEGLVRGEAAAWAQLTYALLLSGLASQALGSADAGCGGEHAMALLMEQAGAAGSAQALAQGERVGVCTVAVASLYHRLAEIEDIAPYLKGDKTPRQEWLTRQLGEAMAAVLLARRAPDPLAAVADETIITCWPEVRRILREVPTPGALGAMLTSVGAKASMQAIGLRDAKVAQLLEAAPYLTDEPTLIRLLERLTLRYSNAKASRAPSRSSRYAESAITRAGKSSAVSASSMR